MQPVEYDVAIYSMATTLVGGVYDRLFGTFATRERAKKDRSSSTTTTTPTTTCLGCRPPFRVRSCVCVLHTAAHPGVCLAATELGLSSDETMKVSQSAVRWRRVVGQCVCIQHTAQWSPFPSLQSRDRCLHIGIRGRGGSGVGVVRGKE